VSFFSWRGDKTTHEEEVNIVYKFATVLDISALYMCLIHLMLHLLQKHLDKSFFLYNQYVYWNVELCENIAVLQLSNSTSSQGYVANSFSILASVPLSG